MRRGRSAGRWVIGDGFTQARTLEAEHAFAILACAAFRAPVLAEELITGKWTGNDTDRGYKVMRLHRSDCDDKPTVELRPALVDGKAQCMSLAPCRTRRSTRAQATTARCHAARSSARTQIGV